ncbi:Wall-associated receptor kinase-like 20 [Bienertia sinuspersici]
MDGSVRANPQEGDLDYQQVPFGFRLQPMQPNLQDRHEPLSWHQRLVIAHQIAEGLAYLHFSAVPPIIHRDIKTSNILLNDKLDVKISDFGLSRLVNIEATHMTTCAQGTLGYLDPQYYRNMQLTDKSDCYSFGVVLLELLTSQKAIDFNREVEAVSLAAYIRKLVKTEKLMDAVDPVLKKGSSKSVLETMKTLGNLAITCLDDERHNRPSIREVTKDIDYMLHIIEIPGSKA